MNDVILLIEDNPTDAKLTLRAFKSSGIASEVLLERDGAAALDYLFATGKHAGRDPGVLPAIVLLDLNLPKVDGLEVLRRIRENQRTTLLPVVVMSASREEEDVSRSYALRVNAYVRKPLQFAEFSKVVHTLGLFWLLINEPPPQVRVVR